jgi:predicted metal-dependent phosphoesterase TrpH
LVLVKADIHIHTNEDTEDKFIKYSLKDIIDEASKKEFGVLAITLHRQVLQSNKYNSLKLYAKKKNILLIRGVEAKIKGKHVLIYNITPEEYSKIDTFEDLRKLRRKNKDIFVMAPHPFMAKNMLTRNCVQDEYFKNKDLFDALEFQQFYSFFMNPNKRTAKIAKEDSKALIASSDLHFKQFFGGHYTIVNVKGPLNEKNFFNAIKNGKTSIVSNVSFGTFCGLFANHIIYAFTKENFRS